MNNNQRELTLTALFIALVAVATMAINIPMVATQGYINVGDTLIFVAALLGGPKVGLLAGGIGSAMADLLLGYGQWAPWTLVVKGVEGLIVGLLAYSVFKQTKAVNFRVIIAMVIAAIWMVVGYYIAGGFIKGFEVALTGIPGDLTQGLGSVVLAIPLLLALKKVPLFK
jgi:uncharacterized membrane protein